MLSMLDLLFGLFILYVWSHVGAHLHWAAPWRLLLPTRGKAVPRHEMDGEENHSEILLHIKCGWATQQGFEVADKSSHYYRLKDVKWKIYGRAGHLVRRPLPIGQATSQLRHETGEKIPTCPWLTPKTYAPNHHRGQDILHGFCKKKNFNPFGKEGEFWLAASCIDHAIAAIRSDYWDTVRANWRRFILFSPFLFVFLLKPGLFQETFLTLKYWLWSTSHLKQSDQLCQLPCEGFEICFSCAPHRPPWSEDPPSKDWESLQQSSIFFWHIANLSQGFSPGTYPWSGHSRCCGWSSVRPASAWLRCRRRSCLRPTAPREADRWSTFQAILKTLTGKTLSQIF